MVFFLKNIYLLENLLKDYLTYYNSMNKNNTNINEDIYNKFYSTLLVEIKKLLKDSNGERLLESIERIIKKKLMRLKRKQILIIIIIKMILGVKR